MTAKTGVTATMAVQTGKALRLAAHSSLFEHGPPDDATSDESFILRLNTLIASQQIGQPKQLPVNMEAAISKSRSLHPTAELIAFGNWLILDGQPGVSSQGGKKPDPHTVLKCAGVCLLEGQFRNERESRGLKNKGRKSRSKEITKHDVSSRWNKLFADTTKPSDFDARLKSTLRLVSAYLEYVGSEKLVLSGKKVNSSPELESLRQSLVAPKENRKRHGSRNSTQLSKVRAKADPFEITLQYSSTDAEIQYRNRTTSSIPLTTIQYAAKLAASLFPTGSERFILKPEVAIKADYAINALIDRIVILFDTTTKTSHQTLQALLKNETKTATFVCDLTVGAHKQNWGKPLPIPDGLKETGFHFAVMIQEPEVKTLKSILKHIDTRFGINGNVGVHLIEISIDFLPKETASSEDAISKREQIVGLLHRHHWTPHNQFLKDDPKVPRYVDARQFFATGKSPSYLFAKRKTEGFHSDGMLKEQTIRDRVLDTGTGRDLYLNSTVIKGERNSAFMVSIQHKIADRRNLAKDTELSLPDRERRARIEVTLSGSATLKERGLTTVQDLSSISFRNLCRPFLSFRLGSSIVWQDSLDDAIAQMKSRGVYGLELRERARLLNGIVERKRAGQTVQGKKDKEGYSLVRWDEMNHAVGTALDNLARRWKQFR